MITEERLCKGRAQIHNALLCEIGLRLFGRVNHEMNVRMMALVMKGGVPFQIFHRDFEILCDCFCLSPKHIPPAFTGIEAKALCILAAKRNDYSPHVAFVFIQLP